MFVESIMWRSRLTKIVMLFRKEANVHLIIINDKYYLDSLICSRIRICSSWKTYIFATRIPPYFQDGIENFSLLAEYVCFNSKICEVIVSLVDNLKFLPKMVVIIGYSTLDLLCNKNKDKNILFLFSGQCFVHKQPLLLESAQNAFFTFC